MEKNLRISSYIRKSFLIYDFAHNPIWISLYMRKILFSFLSVQQNTFPIVHKKINLYFIELTWNFFSYCTVHSKNDAHAYHLQVGVHSPPPTSNHCFKHMAWPQGRMVGWWYYMHTIMHVPLPPHRLRRMINLSEQEMFSLNIWRSCALAAQAKGWGYAGAYCVLGSLEKVPRRRKMYAHKWLCSFSNFATIRKAMEDYSYSKPTQRDARTFIQSIYYLFLKVDSNEKWGGSGRLQ